MSDTPMTGQEGEGKEKEKEKGKGKEKEEYMREHEEQRIYSYVN